MFTWLAVKEFSKKAWKFVVDQWLFFVAAALGIVGFVLGLKGSKAKEVLEIRNKAENEEREARKQAQERTEEVMKILNDKIDELDVAEREAVGEILKENAKELEDKVIENREKPLKDIVGELAAKYGLTKT